MTPVHNRPTSAMWVPPARPGPAAFTTTKVPKFSLGMKSYDRPDETIDSGTLQLRGTVHAAGHYDGPGNHGCGRLHSRSVTESPVRTPERCQAETVWS